MHRLATLLALALAQAGASPAAAPPAAADATAPRPPPASAEPAAPGPPAAIPAVPAAPATAPSAEQPPPPPAEQPLPARKPRRPEAPAPAAAATPAVRATAPPPAAEREQVARAALRFFEALLARRAGDLVGLCAGAFSFDGRTASGSEQIRARFGELFARRDGVAYALEDLAVLPATEAVARYGKPPARVAGLAQAGAWVAVASLSGRPTFLFLARRDGTWVATGMHD